MKTLNVMLILMLGGGSLAPLQAQQAYAALNSQTQPWLMIAKKDGRDGHRDDDEDHDGYEHRHREDAGRRSGYPSPSASPSHSPRPSPSAWPSPSGSPTPSSREIPRNDKPNFKEQLYRQRQEMSD